MKNLKNQSIFGYALIFLSILFMGCSETKDSESVSREVKKHFGEMNFTTTKTSEENLTNLKTFKGKEIIKDKTGKEIETRWLLVTKDNGKVSAIYVGAITLKVSNVSKAMTEDEINDALKECFSKEGAELVTCYKELMRQLTYDCLIEDANCDLVIWQ